MKCFWIDFILIVFVIFLFVIVVGVILVGMVGCNFLSVGNICDIFIGMSVFGFVVIG